MGTYVRITIDVEGTQEEYTNVLDKSFLEIKRLENVFSTYLPNSDISVLNRESVLDGQHTDLRKIITRSLHYTSISRGSFDITIKPVLDLYRRSYEVHGRAPESSELTEALSLVDSRNIRLNEKSIHLTKTGVQITTDAIAKGYIIDRTIDYILKSGIIRAMVNIGGDIKTVGDGWTVALQDPRDETEYILTVALHDQAIATSGDYERFFRPDKKAHHIINPKTGRSAASLISATIVAATAMDADALATAVFVMGPQLGLGLIEQLDEVEGLFIDTQRSVYASTGFKWISIGEDVIVARNPYTK